MKKFSLALLLLCMAVTVHAGNFSFFGNFTTDDNGQFFNFTVGATSDVTLRSWSYAGGTNAAGDVIARGGFDPILALFDSTGSLIGQNDDGGCGLVSADALTGECWDTFFTATALAPGNYTASIQEFDNFSNGSIGAGFVRDGQGNFTSGPGCVAPFCDVSGVVPGNQRDGHWAFDVLNVAAATTGVPEPATFLLIGAGLTALGLTRRFRKI